jgi:hypothetical protein
VIFILKLIIMKNVLKKGVSGGIRIRGFVLGRYRVSEC